MRVSPSLVSWLLGVSVGLAACHTATSTITNVFPQVIDPLGGSHLRLSCTGLGSVTAVVIGGATASSTKNIDTNTVDCITAAIAAGGGLEVSVISPSGSAKWSGTVEAWSPAEIENARVFDASSGVKATEAAVTYQWARLTSEINPNWRQRDGAQLAWIPSTERFWMIAGWNGYEPPDGFGASITTNEVWSTKDGVSWVRELEHGNSQFASRHFVPILSWHERVWMVGGDIFSTIGNYVYQHDILSTADGVTWKVELEQTPWSDRIFETAGIYKNEMWVVGGQTGLSSIDSLEDPTFHNDVWKSADGVTWTQVAADGPASPTRWSGRGMISKLVEFKDRLWLVGGGDYDTPNHPVRSFYNEVWSTTDGVSWKQHATPPWNPRQYHSVEIFDGKLWVIGGYQEAISNSNDSWFTEDGEAWTAIPLKRCGLPPSHADGVAVGPDFLMFAGGNYSFGYGGEPGSPNYQPDKSAWRLKAFHGTAVDGWVDRASGLEVNAKDTMRPILVPNAFGAEIPGIVFDGLEHVLVRETSDLQPSGRSIFFVAQAPHTENQYDPSIESEYNPIDTVVGDITTQVCAAGLNHGALSYTQNADGKWQKHNAGSGYQDRVDDVICVGFTQDENGFVQAWGDGIAIGDTIGMGYTPEYQGWNSIGAGLSYNDGFAGTLGAVVILPTATDAATVAKIHAWAQGRFLAR